MHIKSTISIDIAYLMRYIMCITWAKKGDGVMDKEKLIIVESSITDYKKLSEPEKMYVLGFMQGRLLESKDENSNNGQIHKSKYK